MKPLTDTIGHNITTKTLTYFNNPNITNRVVGGKHYLIGIPIVFIEWFFL